MRPTGFSTGALSKGDFDTALSWLSESDSDAIELSALRGEELLPLLDAVESMDLSRFSYKAIHVPKSFDTLSESDVVELLIPFIKAGFRFILHPDVVSDIASWKKLGKFLCVENMDMRKQTGRTAAELQKILDLLPDAKICFDIGHARQVDPSMSVAMEIVQKFGDRIEQVHASEVDSSGGHWAISKTCYDSFDLLAKYLPQEIPIIIESQVDQCGIENEMEWVRSIFK